MELVTSKSCPLITQKSAKSSFLSMVSLLVQLTQKHPKQIDVTVNVNQTFSVIVKNLKANILSGYRGLSIVTCNSTPVQFVVTTKYNCKDIMAVEYENS